MTAALAGHRVTADLERAHAAIVEFRAADHGPVAPSCAGRCTTVQELAAFAEPGR